MADYKYFSTTLPISFFLSLLLQDTLIEEKENNLVT
jgi:hypothetical protein